MKKLMTLLLAAALTVCVAQPASAVEVRVNGTMDFGFEYTGNMSNNAFAYSFMDGADVAAQGSVYHQKHTAAVQRLILGIQFTVSENLSGYWDGIFGYFTWGGPASGVKYPPQQNGGALGSRSANIITRQAYLDWMIPNTDIKIRMGQHLFTMPGFACGNPSMANEFGTGITVSAPINENVSLTALWVRVNSDPRRGASAVSSMDDTLDLFTVLVPLKFDGIKAIPWVGMAVAGKGGISYNHMPGEAMVGGRLTPQPDAVKAAGWATPDAGLSSSVMWWVGFDGELTKFDPFRFGLDMYYSNNGQSESAYRRSGWYVSGAASYATKWGIPALKGWYASGDDGNVRNGAERPLFINGGFAMPGTDIFYSSPVGNIEKSLENGLPNGSWGISAQWNNLSLINDLFHSLHVTYIRGTNSPAMARYADPNYIYSYITDKDSLLEVNFTSTYNIYRNLAATLMLSYAMQDFDEKLWTDAARQSGKIGPDKHVRFSNAWRASMVLRYTF